MKKLIIVGILVLTVAMAAPAMAFEKGTIRLGAGSGLVGGTGFSTNTISPDAGGDIDLDVLSIDGGYFITDRLELAFQYATEDDDGIEVDISTPDNDPVYKQIEAGNMHIKISQPEDMLFANVKQLLLSNKNSKAIAQKPLDNVDKLWETVDQKLFLSLLEKYYTEYETYLPADFKSKNPLMLLKYIQALKETVGSEDRDGVINITLNHISRENKTTRRCINVRRKIQKTTGKWNRGNCLLQYLSYKLFYKWRS